MELSRNMVDHGGVWMEYEWNTDGIWMEYGRTGDTYEGILADYGWNMVEHRWSISEYGWNMDGRCMEHGGNMDGI